jgi:hypothetical protein
MFHNQDNKGTLYHIRVKGSLDPKWADWFEGFALSSGGDNETLLSGRVADQAALYGMLGKINRLGMPLVLVVQVDQLSIRKCCPLCGHQIDVDRL